MKTKVIFRKYTTGEIVALFPAVAATVGNPNHCQSYMHVGQHGAADVFEFPRTLKLAMPSEYRELAAELRRIGYKLDIRKRMTCADLEARKEQLK